MFPLYLYETVSLEMGFSAITKVWMPKGSICFHIQSHLNLFRYHLSIHTLRLVLYGQDNDKNICKQGFNLLLQTFTRDMAY